EQDDAGCETCVGWIESGVVEADRLRILEAEEACDRGAFVLEEPEPRPPGGGQRARGVAEEALHLLVHETRLADLGEPVKIEESCERGVPAAGRVMRGHGRPRQLALELTHLPSEFVPVLARQRGQVLVPARR